MTSIPAAKAKAEAGAPDDDLPRCEVVLREFCAWLDRRELTLCSAGYAGEVVDVGGADRFLDIYLASRSTKA